MTTWTEAEEWFLIGRSVTKKRGGTRSSYEPDDQKYELQVETPSTGSYKQNIMLLRYWSFDFFCLNNFTE